ncbi:EcsC family protein [Clostridium neonatale]|uniref:EcsC family protein n=1 Tax=Clostridium neonatale TaxID=137838 RepID=UPI003D330BF1
MEKLKLPSSEELQNALECVLDFVISNDYVTIENYVEKLREQNKGISCDELAKKILHRKSIKNGFIGAVTSVGGLITLPVSIPSDLICSWRIQASMAFSIAYVYGHTKDTTDLKTDLYLILAGDSAKEALKRFGIEASKSFTKKLIDKYITREVMVKIWKVIGQKIITKAGEKSMTSFVKMVPIVGAPIGFAFDWATTQTVGKFAMKYYRG